MHISNIKQRFYNWYKKHELIMIWWRYDNDGVPHKIGVKLFGKIYIKYRNVI